MSRVQSPTVSDLIDELRAVGEDLSPQLAYRPPPFDMARIARALEHLYAATVELIEFEKTLHAYAPLNSPSERSSGPQT